MKVRRYSSSMSIKGAINALRGQRTGPTMLCDASGRNIPPAEAIAFLTCEQARGRNLMPMSRECGNPCQHADKGCTGYDHVKGGCPGYEVEASITPISND